MVTTTRDRILEEAAKLFTEKGYEATSVQDLAQALGLSLRLEFADERGEVLARFSLAADEPVAETTDSSWENAGVSPKPASGKASWASWAA